MEYIKRKPTRLKEYDYGTPGAYFVTICTKDRCELLSEIIVGDGVLDIPKNKLTEYGKIADKHINQMDAFYQHISVDKYIIMPNHIHLILSVKEFKNCDGNGMSGTPSPTNMTIPQFISTFKRFCNKEYGKPLFQRSYHDHIIRNKEDYRKIWEYIEQNAERWEKDCYYTSKTYHI